MTNPNSATEAALRLAEEAPDRKYLHHRLERSLRDFPNSLGIRLHRDFLQDVLAALAAPQQSEAVAWMEVVAMGEPLVGYYTAAYGLEFGKYKLYTAPQLTPVPAVEAEGERERFEVWANSDDGRAIVSLRRNTFNRSAYYYESTITAWAAWLAAKADAAHQQAMGGRGSE